MLGNTAKTLSVCMLVLSVIGCGPSIYTKVRFEYSTLDSSKAIQADGGITVERVSQNPVQPPEIFFANVQKCDPQTGRLIVEPQVLGGPQPVMEKVSILPEGCMLEKINITNKTGHVVRLNTAVISAFDPANNSFPMLTKEEISAKLFSSLGLCNTNTGAQLVNQLNMVKLLDKNTELLPDRTETKYLIYQPQSLQLPGVWKLTLYDVPVETSPAGQVTKTVNFSLESVCKQFKDTYKQEPFKKPVLTGTEEVK